jgi:pimeloyl-ACP methyl ester carboxylesterase
MIFLGTMRLSRVIRLVLVLGAILVLATECISRCRATSSSRAGDLDDLPAMVTIELREGLTISTVRERRSAVNVDPIAGQVMTGTWTMPRSGDSVAFRGGQTKKWEPVKAGADGWFAEGALRGGYLAASFAAADESVMMLEATGHAMVYAGGEPRGGDIYSNGYVQLPVQVRKGQNALLFQVGRGKLKARLTKPKASAFFSTADLTLPDLNAGEPAQFEGAVLVVSARADHCEDLAIVAGIAGGPETRTVVPILVPLSMRKVAFELRGTAPSTGETVPLSLRLERKANGDRGEWKTIDSTKVDLRVRQPGQTYTRTFRSSIDGSLQYYAVVPALPAPDGQRSGLILTLHGAGVEGLGQAQCYSRKPGIYVVAPTNRRPYGFDWEDWGRLDAIEVLELAQKVFNTDREQTYLTGHSMGGHGTWHLGVTFPDRFAAIGPSAGWISMWTYVGARRAESASHVEELMGRAMGPSDTVALSKNLSRLGVYILHGDADDNVPVDQARQMRKLLGEFHPDFAYHEQGGAGHWWGNPCVDWPPLIAFLANHKIPRPSDVKKIDFVTASPAVSSRAHWLAIEAQLKALLPSKVHIELDQAHRKFRGTTENVARLALDPGRALPDAKATEPLAIELDGQVMTSSGAAPSAPDGTRKIWLVRDGSKWSVCQSAPAAGQKGPARQGPFKEAFRNRFVLVFGTKGTPEENAWSLARARFDAETFWYRGNGSVDVVSDSRFLEPGREPEFRDRNVIVYGHAESNAAWPVLLGESPVQVRRGEVKLGPRGVTGDDLACVFIRPRPGSDVASVGVITGSGLTGLRLTERLPYFTSGVAYPDCVLLRAKTVLESSAAPIAAGYFGIDWSIQSGEFAWRE